MNLLVKHNLTEAIEASFKFSWFMILLFVSNIAHLVHHIEGSSHIIKFKATTLSKEEFSYVLGLNWDESHDIFAA